MSLAIWCHTVLPVTPHKRTHPALTPASEGYYSIYTYPGGMEGWVDRGAWLRLDLESNPWPLGRKSDALTVLPPCICVCVRCYHDISKSFSYILIKLAMTRWNTFWLEPGQTSGRVYKLDWNFCRKVRSDWRCTRAAKFDKLSHGAM